MSFMKSFQGLDLSAPEFQQQRYELFGDFTESPNAYPEQGLTDRYDFRPAAREASKYVTITWIDQDDSGTYDPQGKRRPSPLPYGRKKRARHELPENRAPKRPKTSSWQLGRFIGCRMIVTFKLKTEAGIAWQKFVGTAHDNWPEASSDFAQAQSLGYGGKPTSDDTDRELVLREPRQRSRPSLLDGFHFNGCALPDLADITLGHPAARGCKGCFAKREDCPLLKEGSRYPCETCREDEIDCDLIVQPLEKSGCEACSKKKRTCSYREKGSHPAQPCCECAKAGLKCVAGPKSGRTRTGPSLDQGRQGGRVGCAGCTRGFGEQMAKPRRKPRPTISKKAADPGTPVGQDTTRYKTITTKLAHPITFNYEPDEENPCGEIYCNWCDDLGYGLLGLGLVQPEVYDNGRGKGYTEVADGHTTSENKLPPSRICGFCINDRLKIMSCEGHDLAAIPDMDPKTFDHESVKGFMEPGKADSAPFNWCSVCPSAAFYKCSAEISNHSHPDLKPLDAGCGLHLCESCACALVNEYEGVLERLIDVKKKEEEEGQDGGFGLRADADFLHPKGEILRRLVVPTTRQDRRFARISPVLQRGL